MNYSPVIGRSALASVNNSVNNNVELIVHINEPMDGASRNSLQFVVLEDKGVVSAEFCPGRYHLLLVRYDATKLTSRDVLALVVAQNLSAQLVGPI